MDRDEMVATIIQAGGSAVGAIVLENLQRYVREECDKAYGAGMEMQRRMLRLQLGLAVKDDMR